jgi:hypothetical protein
VIPADLGAELARAITAAVISGDYPPAARDVTQAGTWRPAGPGGYASSLPFGLAAVTGEPPAQIARQLARRIESVTWIASARATGAGYLTVTVTPAVLAALVPRIVSAGPACTRSAAPPAATGLASSPGAVRSARARSDGPPAATGPASPLGATRPAHPLPDLAAAPDWYTAWRHQAAALAGRLAEAAGTTTSPDIHPERLASGTRRREASLGTVADAVAFAGADAVRYALSRIPADRPGDVASYARALDRTRRAGPAAAPRELPPGLPLAAPSAGPRPHAGEPQRQQTQFCCPPNDSKSEFAAAGAEGDAGSGGRDGARRGAGGGIAAGVIHEAGLGGGACQAGGEVAGESGAGASREDDGKGDDGPVGGVELCGLADPYYAVSFAHADAASVLRWGAELGLTPGEWPASPPRYAEPELAVLTRLSWLPERVAAAARRDRPAEFPRYLEALASDWRECRERCPALPFGGRSAPRDQSETAARLWLADAVRVALAAGLGLVGVTARDRL